VHATLKEQEHLQWIWISSDHASMEMYSGDDMATLEKDIRASAVRMALGQSTGEQREASKGRSRLCRWPGCYAVILRRVAG
jgi:hypothetical protein